MSSRRAIEKRSAPLLFTLHSLPRLVVPITMLALMLIGTTIKSPLGGLFLLPIALFVLWLIYLAWPTLTPRQQMMRVLVIVIVWSVMILRLLGKA